MRRKDHPGHYYSLAAIAAAAGCCETTLRNRILKWRFPAFRMPIQCNRLGWYSNDKLMEKWWQDHIEESWSELAASATGKARAYTRDDSIEIHLFTTDDGSWID